MKFIKANSWLLFAVGAMLVIQSCIWYVKSEKKFPVTYMGAVDRQNYEDDPATVRVVASPAIKWDQSPGLWKALGRIFWLTIIGAAFYIGTDRLKNASMAANLIAFVSPIVLSCLCFFCSYSASLNEGTLVKHFTDFKAEFKISDEQAGKIERQEIKNIKDESGLLTTYFKK
jgi:hypothetical protein